MTKEDKDKKEILSEEQTPIEEAPAEAAAEEAPAEAAAEEAPEEVDYKNISMFAKKLGMTRLFFDDGNENCPVTVVEAGPCFVSQIKTIDSDGYNSIQISYGDIKEKNSNKAMKGHYSKAGLKPNRFLKEFRVDDVSEFNLGDEINVNVFKEGDTVNVSGKSIGKGFAGHMKRHGFGGGRRSHGKNSVMRKSGSIGAGSDPSRVWKGTRMAGRMGGDNVSIKNMAIMKVDLSKNLLYLKGSVPGSNKGLLFISK